MRVLQLSPLVPAGFMFLSLVTLAHADVFLFKESSGLTTLEATSSRVDPGTCHDPTSNCNFIVSAPDVTAYEINIAFAFIGEQFPILDSQGLVLAQFNFLPPDTGPTPPVGLPYVVQLLTQPGDFGQPIPGLTADGTIQDVFSVQWSDGTIDQIQFQLVTPEPTTLLLLATVTFLIARRLDPRRTRR